MGRLQNLLRKDSFRIRILHQQKTSDKIGYPCSIHASCLFQGEEPRIPLVSKLRFLRRSRDNGYCVESRRAIWCVRCGEKIKSRDLLAQILVI